jgi:hypothetical protein
MSYKSSTGGFVMRSAVAALLCLPFLLPATPLAEAAQPRFVVCSYGRPASACVYDGDTFWFSSARELMWQCRGD